MRRQSFYNSQGRLAHEMKSTESLLKGLLESHDDDIVWIFEHICASRPAIRDHFGLPDRGHTGLVPQVKPVVFTKPENDLGKQRDTIVQFSTFWYFVKEDDKCISLDVFRHGELGCRSEVSFTTRDATAKAGEAYVPIRGTLMFEEGEDEKCLEVPVIQSKEWKTVLEFEVVLLQEGTVGAILDSHLYSARVHVIDNTPFPSDGCRQKIEDPESRAITWNYVFLEYCKLTFRHPTIRKGAIKIICVDFLHNCHLLFSLLLQVYLFDFVLEKGYDVQSLVIKSRYASLLFIVIVQAVLHILLHLLDYAKLSWQVGGTARTIIQKSVLIAFLNYSEPSRLKVDHGDIVTVMDQDAKVLASNGFGKALKLFRDIGFLVIILVYQLVAPALFEKDPSHLIYFALVGFPVLLLVFLRVRKRKTRFAMQTEASMLERLVSKTVQIVNNYPLIRDFHRRNFFLDPFQESIKSYNRSCVAASKIMRNNSYFAEFNTMLLLGVYTLIGGMQVLDGGSLGMFMVNLRVIQSIGYAMNSIYKTLLTVASTYPALMRIVQLLNLPSDLYQRMELSARLREGTIKRREGLRRNAQQASRLDSLPISLHNLEYTYHEKNYGNCSYGPKVDTLLSQEKRLTLKEDSILIAGKLEVEQGNAIALTGSAGLGKSTLLNIIGCVYYPKGYEHFFIPAHLRVLNVSAQPLFYVGTMMENLTFGIAHKGVRHATPDGKDVLKAEAPERVMKICSRLGLNSEVTDCLHTEDCRAWGDVMSKQNLQLLSLARALISDPDMLCLHHPTDALDEIHRMKAFTALKNFCDERGLEHNPDTWHSRRPHTCFFSTARLEGLHVADYVYRIGADHSIEKMDMHKAHDDANEVHMKVSM